MKQPSRTPEYLVVQEELERISQQWVVNSDLIQSFLDLEVDLVVLSRELTRLGDMSTRIGTGIRKLRVQGQEQ